MVLEEGLLETSLAGYEDVGRVLRTQSVDLLSTNAPIVVVVVDAAFQVRTPLGTMLNLNRACQRVDLIAVYQRPFAVERRVVPRRTEKAKNLI